MTTEARSTDETVSIGMEVVLNGGKKEMNSATIPVQWVFSDETIEKAPKYLLFFEQTEVEASSFGSADYGRRYVCKVSEGVKFIPVFKPGYHRMAVLALAGNDEILEKQIEILLAKESTNNYLRSISWSHLEEGIIPKILDNIVVAVTIVEFTVPEELFAEKPRTRFENAIWRWVNLWFDGEPNDECDYRQRKIIAFTLQPVFFLVASVVYASIVFLGSLLIFFCGYRPKNILHEVWVALKLQRPEFDMREYDDYRVWEMDHGNVTKRMPVTGIELSLFVLFLMGVLTIDFSGGWWRVLPAVLIILCFLFFMGIIVVLWLNRLPVSPEKKKEEEEKARQRRLERERLAAERYQRWLERFFGLSHRPSEVDLRNLPPPPTVGGRVVQNFRVSFWVLKARVCRPYSK